MLHFRCVFGVFVATRLVVTLFGVDESMKGGNQNKMSQNLRVLLVDDDPVVSKCIMKQLDQIGCVYRATPSHVRALAVLERDELINMVLLDHGATNGCVGEFVSAAQAIRPNIKIIGCSANDCSREFAEFGVIQFLRKPPDLFDLEEVLGLSESSADNAADTRIGKTDSDTGCLRFAYGERVRVVDGPLEGLVGTFVCARTGGKILVKLKGGVYLETHQYHFELGGT